MIIYSIPNNQLAMSYEASKVLSQANAVAILVAMYEARSEINVTALWHEVGSGYSAIKNSALRLHDYGLVSLRTQDRTMFVDLTPVGRAVAKHLSDACFDLQNLLDAGSKQ